MQKSLAEAAVFEDQATSQTEEPTNIRDQIWSTVHLPKREGEVYRNTSPKQGRHSREKQVSSTIDKLGKTEAEDLLLKLLKNSANKGQALHRAIVDILKEDATATSRIGSWNMIRHLSSHARSSENEKKGHINISAGCLDTLRLRVIVSFA